MHGYPSSSLILFGPGFDLKDFFSLNSVGKLAMEGEKLLVDWPGSTILLSGPMKAEPSLLAFTSSEYLWPIGFADWSPSR